MQKSEILLFLSISHLQDIPGAFIFVRWHLKHENCQCEFCVPEKNDGSISAGFRFLSFSVWWENFWCHVWEVNFLCDYSARFLLPKRRKGGKGIDFRLSFFLCFSHPLLFLYGCITLSSNFCFFPPLFFITRFLCIISMI